MLYLALHKPASASGSHQPPRNCATILVVRRKDGPRDCSCDSARRTVPCTCNECMGPVIRLHAACLKKADSEKLKHCHATATHLSKSQVWPVVFTSKA